MSKKIAFTSASTDGTNAVLLTLNESAKKGFLNPANFLASASNGSTISSASASFIDKRTIRVEFSPDFTPNEDFLLLYAPPKADQKKGVIQDKKGKDAPSLSIDVLMPPPSIDPLTNAWIYNGNTYQLVTEGKTWPAAVEDAIARGGYLVKVDDLAENQQLFDQVIGRLTPSDINTTRSTIAGGGASYIWLGASDLKSEGTWIWTKNGEVVTLDTPPWGSGALGREPDNFDNQDGLSMGLQNWPVGLPPGQGLGLAGQWNDQNVAENYFYVVEYDGILPVV